MASANNQTLGFSAANRLNSASGPFGAQSWIFDGVGNRTSQTIAGTTDTYTYPAGSNKVQSVVRSAVTQRSFAHDGAGNMTTDTRSSGGSNIYAYTYNKANRLKTVSFEGNLQGTYTYNGLEQLISRVITNSGTANGAFLFALRVPTRIRAGTSSTTIAATPACAGASVIAELNATGANVREYIYLREAEISPTRQSRAQVDIPVAVVDAVNTATPVLWSTACQHAQRQRDVSQAGRWPPQPP